MLTATHTRAWAALTALLMLFGLLAGCAPNPEPTPTPTPTPTPHTIGIVLPTKDEPRWLQDEAKFREVIEAAGYHYEILWSQGKSDVEKINVETLLAKGIRVLIICPQDSAAAVAAADAAAAKGVKVIAYDRLIHGSNVDYYVAFDSFNVGEVQGQYLVDNATGKDNPLYLYCGGTWDNSILSPFFQGAWEALQPKIADGTFTVMNSPKAVELKEKATLTREEMFAIMGQIDTDWSPEVAKKLAEDHIVAYPPPADRDLFLLCPNDFSARAISDAFRVTGNKYWITGQDAEIPSIQYIIDGKQSMTVLKDVRTLAKDAAEMAIALCDGRTPSTNATANNQTKDIPTRQTEPVVVTKDNVKSAIIDSGYHDASNFTGL